MFRLTAILLFTLAGVASADGLTVEVKGADGKLTKLEEASFGKRWTLRGKKDASEVTFDLADVISLQVVGNSALARPEGSQVLFPTGEVIAGDIMTSEEETVVLQGKFNGRLEIPLTVVQGVILLESVDATKEKIEDLTRAIRQGKRTGDQVLLKNGDALTGLFLKLSSANVEIMKDDAEAQVDREVVAALAIDPTLLDYRAPEGLHALLRFKDGSSIRVSEMTTDGWELKAMTAIGLPVEIDSRLLVDVTMYNGRAVYLSDLEPVEEVAEAYWDDRRERRQDLNVLGQPIRIGETVYTKGIGVKSHSSLSYDVGSYERFEAIAGLDRAAGYLASVRFLVLVDGETRFDSGEMTVRSEPAAINVDIAGGKRLTLVVDYASRGDVQDYADWADARMVR
ncbi:NPCBM/NEW2 domain protein [Planctomycetes bacterium Pan216]|uniref:NPCBM/NEW2 domain protein n=1 Tax=Kolteria novifilia TaxID=2527975 RepID=A0A518AZ95_9BACT|nr:NPCBM/NEW2 domain protein [Planctomycetes bacterium Pan216]